jgi:hypothetical protein
MFPLGYFQAKLPQGSTLAQVHTTVRGYKRVLHCPTGPLRSLEVYYFFSTRDDVALRFEVWYDEQSELIAIQGEDSNSRHIQTDGCGPGPLSE